MTETPNPNIIDTDTLTGETMTRGSAGPVVEAPLVGGTVSLLAANVIQQ